MCPATQGAERSGHPVRDRAVASKIAQQERRTATAMVKFRAILMIMSTLLAFRVEATPLIDAMSEGGVVVYLRHAITDESQRDTGRLNDRAGQRNLNEAGRAQAAAIGDAFRALGVRFHRILASPVYRARDTAEIAFGADAVEVTMDVVADDYAGARLREMLEATAALLNTPPPPGQVLLIVGHRTPLEMVRHARFPDSVLPEGAMAVFLPGPDGPTQLGTITAEALIDAATP
jgi:phosphohistidine phosphatase SixA